MVYLNETLCSISYCSSFLINLGFSNFSGLDVIEKKVGNVLFWSDNVHCNVLDHAPNEITVEFQEGSHAPAYLSCVYGPLALMKDRLFGII